MKSLRFISVVQLLEMIENKEDMVIVDVLSADSYAEGHLPDAVSLPLEELEKKAPDLLPDKSKMVVTYCANFMCGASSSAARKLMEMGYEGVLDYKGGKKDWAENAWMPLAS